LPREVAINEAVVLAKRYATEDAARLVNGILGRVAREGGRMTAIDDALAKAEELLGTLNARRGGARAASPPRTTSTATLRSISSRARELAARSRPS
jgi:N utilization substance protein B